jgi:hypothetical protein
LNRSQQLAGFRAESGEAQNAIVVGDERLDEAAIFAVRVCAQDRGHGNLRQAVVDTLRSGLRFAQADVDEFGIGE